MLLGLKASTDERQIRDRLQYHPDVFEFHLTEADFTASGWQHFLKMVAWVQSQVRRDTWYLKTRCRQSLGMAILRLRRVCCAGGYHWLMILAMLLSRYTGIMSD